MAATGPVHGMRDFLPLEVRRRTWLVDRFRDVYERYGYEPIDTPALERLDVLLGKGGDDNEKLIFKVLKRGQKLAIARGVVIRADGTVDDAQDPEDLQLADAGLRFDLTVPLARYVAEHRAKLPRVFRRYQIGPVWRADRPARGRFREFYQCDVDIVGASSPMAEVDVILATGDALAAAGFDRFTVHLNDRRLLATLLVSLGVPDSLHGAAVVTLDKLDKIGLEGVCRELVERGVPEPVTTALGELRVDEVTAAPAADGLARICEFVEKRGPSCAELARDLALVIERVASVRAERIRFVFDPLLARGMGYYTGPIFEIRAPDVPFSLGGGGRYDGLIGRFANQSLPAVGFSLGFERILTLMAEADLFPAHLGLLDAYVTVFAPEEAARALALADELRARGLRVVVPVEASGLRAQMKEANDRSVRWTLIEGPSEREAGNVQVKTMATGEAEMVPRPEVAGRLAQRTAHAG